MSESTGRAERVGPDEGGAWEFWGCGIPWDEVQKEGKAEHGRLWGPPARPFGGRAGQNNGGGSLTQAEYSVSL